MTLKELIRTSRKIIDGRLRFDPFSRFYKSPLFRQSTKKIDLEEVRQIQDQLLEAHIFSHLEISKRKLVLKVIRQKESRKRSGWFINLLLLLATIATTSATGAMLRGHNPFSSWQELSYGFSYSFALLSILLFHEMGHYFAARYYRVRVTLPYFIPFILPAFHPGTMGAFIKMRSAIPGKKALFDIGVAGPLAGFVVSLLFLVIGFWRLPNPEALQQIVNFIHNGSTESTIDLYLGNTFLFDLLARLFHKAYLPMNEMYHFPFLFAGWFGLFVTALNLMPIGQLDGGHLTYAMFGDRARKVALGGFGLLILLNLYIISNYNSYIWVSWSLLILIFIRFRHPPTMNDSEQLGRKRILLGWLAFAVFVLCFSPLPFYLK